MRATIAAAAVLLVGGCYQVTEQPELAGQDVHLTVLHTSDIHARILPYFQVPGLIDRGLGSCAELQPFGGGARMAHLIKRERARSGRVMHLDSGDVFQGAPIFNEFKGEVEMRVLGAISPDGVVIGNHEFDLGSQNIALQYERFGKGLFPLLVANYIFTDPADPTRHALGSLTKPYEILNLEGLRVAVIGMGNTSSMTSIAQGGNSLGITPLEPVEALRTLVDHLSRRADLIFVVSHMGLTSRGTLNLAEDQEMITGYVKTIPKTSLQPNWEVLNEEPNNEVRVRIPGIVGIDAIFGGHLHIVLNPPKVLIDPAGREVLLVHSGAFAKYFGRADFVVRVPKADEEAPFGAEIVSHGYKLFPITGRIPKVTRGTVVACPDREFDPRTQLFEDCPGCRTDEVERGRDEVDFNTPCSNLANAEEELKVCEVADICRRNGDACSLECRQARTQCSSIPAPVDGEVLQMLDPYVQRLYQKQDLNKGFAFATERISRFGLSGEDSPLGNLVADSMRFRNRVEAQFSMTNTLGIRTNMERGVVTIEEMFNIFPFENTLTTMYLSGIEVQELFDYVTERSSERGCQTQAQISGVEFVMNCAQAIRNISDPPACMTTADCEATQFAELGADNPVQCRAGQCFKSPAEKIVINGRPVNPTESYKVAVNDFIGRGGSGFEVLRRNTTKVNTNLSLRDALIDYMRAAPGEGPGRVCGSKAMTGPIPFPTSAYATISKMEVPGASCSSPPPRGCAPSSGILVECKEDEMKVQFYCIPYDFPDPDNDVRGDECDELARFTPIFERYETDDDPSKKYCEAAPTGCPGQLHCCEKPLGTRNAAGQFMPNGKVEVSFYCMVPYCVDPLATGRIQRVVQ